MSQSANPSYIPYLDHLRVIAAVAVVAAHVILGTLDTVEPLSIQWWAGQWLCLLCQCAVPIFVMISGALLLGPAGPNETLRRFYGKRFRRLGIPLVFWTALYFVIRAVFDHEPVTLGYVLERIWVADPPYHTYYLFLVVWLYMLTPALRRYVERTAPKSRQLVLVILFAWATLYALINPMLWQNGRSVISFYLPYLGFYLCGYELHHSDHCGLKRWHVVGIIFLCGMYIVLQSGSFLDYLGRFQGRCVLGFFSLPVIVMSIGVFWSARLMNPQGLKETRWGRSVQHLAPCTFGIYLCHIAILIGLREALSGEADQGGFLVGILAGTTVAFVLSYLLTRLLRRIPYLRWLV
jgi:surface polysaccharide O-acyltransferase-like enzyme